MVHQYIRYKATTETGGSIEFSVIDHWLKDEQALGKGQEYLAHECWREILKERDLMNRPVNQERRNLQRMLKSIIDKIGVDKAKAQFTKSLQFERITP